MKAFEENGRRGLIQSSRLQVYLASWLPDNVSSLQNCVYYRLLEGGRTSCKAVLQIWSEMMLLQLLAFLVAADGFVHRFLPNSHRFAVNHVGLQTPIHYSKSDLTCMPFRLYSFEGGDDSESFGEDLTYLNEEFMRLAKGRTEISFDDFLGSEAIQAILSDEELDDDYLTDIREIWTSQAKSLDAKIGLPLFVSINREVDDLFEYVDDDEEVDFTDHWSVLMVRKFTSTNPSIESGRVFSKGVTPLFLCLVCIEVCDVVFAFDSMPVIVAVVRDPYLMITSSLWAAAGLRSLYFLLIAAQSKLWALDKAIMILLIFVSFKLIGSAVGLHISPAISVSVVAFILTVGVIWSLTVQPPEDKNPKDA